jgi:hypothetical protein
MTVLLLIYVAAFVAAVLHAAKPPVPIWIAVVLLCIAGLIQVLPTGG